MSRRSQDKIPLRLDDVTSEAATSISYSIGRPSGSSRTGVTTQSSASSSTGVVSRITERMANIAVGVLLFSVLVVRSATFQHICEDIASRRPFTPLSLLDVAPQTAPRSASLQTVYLSPDILGVRCVANPSTLCWSLWNNGSLIAQDGPTGHLLYETSLPQHSGTATTPLQFVSTSAGNALQSVLCFWSPGTSSVVILRCGSQGCLPPAVQLAVGSVQPVECFYQEPVSSVSQPFGFVAVHSELGSSLLFRINWLATAASLVTNFPSSHLGLVAQSGSVYATVVSNQSIEVRAYNLTDASFKTVNTIRPYCASQLRVSAIFLYLLPLRFTSPFDFVLLLGSAAIVVAGSEASCNILLSGGASQTLLDSRSLWLLSERPLPNVSPSSSSLAEVTLWRWDLGLGAQVGPEPVALPMMVASEEEVQVSVDGSFVVLQHGALLHLVPRSENNGAADLSLRM